MRKRTLTVAAAAVVAMGLVTTPASVAEDVPTQTAAAAESAPALPGMCNGRTDPDTVVIAHAGGNPRTGLPKYILNVATDGAGLADGTLVYERGAARLLVEDFCRVWQHLPGDPYGGGSSCEEEEPEEGAVTAHAVGLGTLRDGATVLVRTDVRGTEEGEFFRLRYRPWGGTHHEAALDDGHDGGDEGGCEDDGWTKYPEETDGEHTGWAPLTRMMVHLER